MSDQRNESVIALGSGFGSRPHGQHANAVARFALPWRGYATAFADAYGGALGLVPQLRAAPFDLVLVTLRGPRDFVEALTPSIERLLKPSADGVAAAVGHLPSFAAADVVLVRYIDPEPAIEVIFANSKREGRA